MDLPDGLTDEAKAARDEFLALMIRTAAAARRIPLNILVWGKAMTDTSFLANKRKQIRDELLNAGHNAMFSEELSYAVAADSEKLKEHIQALLADMIVVLLEDSPGALAEAHDFCNHPKIAPIAFVLVPNRYKTGYSAAGAITDLEHGYGGVKWYEPEELTSCTVLESVMKRAEARRNIKFYSDGLHTS